MGSPEFFSLPARLDAPPELVSLSFENSLNRLLERRFLNPLKTPQLYIVIEAPECSGHADFVPVGNVSRSFVA